MSSGSGHGRPRDSSLTLKPSSFTTAKKHGGTLISYRDSEAASTKLVVLRKQACPAPPRHPRKGAHKKRCSPYVKVGSFTHADLAGVNRLHFSGRLGAVKLRPGTYRLTATPRNANGTGATIEASFRIK